MSKRFLAGLFIVIVASFFAVAAWAEDPRLPKGVSRIDPIRIDDWVSGGASAPQGITAAAVPIPPMPSVFLYQILDTRGAQIGMSASFEFLPIQPVQAQLFINGQNIASVWSLVNGNGGTLPKGSVVDLKAYRQFADAQMPFFLPVGQYDVEVRIFPFFNLPLYWAMFFSVRVDPFEFWAEQCADDENAVVRYHIAAIGVPPKVVSISVADLVSSVEVVKGTAKWRLQRALYDERLAGRVLATTLGDEDARVEVTREIWYASGLQSCGALPVLGLPAQGTQIR